MKAESHDNDDNELMMMIISILLYCNMVVIFEVEERNPAALAICKA